MSLNRKIIDSLDRVNFLQVFLAWLLFILFFAHAYYFLTAYTDSKLIYRYVPLGEGSHGYWNSIYFSFITTTSLGYGDIAPTGYSKILAVIEVMLGLVMNGLLIVKLASVKEYTAINEIYDLSFHQQLDRLRANLTLDRTNFAKFRAKLRKNHFTKIDNEGLKLLYVNLQTHLFDVLEFTDKRKNEDFTKNITPYQLQLLVKSVKLALEKCLSLNRILTKQYKELAEPHLDSIKGSVEGFFKVAELKKDKTVNDSIKEVRDMLF